MDIVEEITKLFIDYYEQNEPVFAKRYTYYYEDEYGNFFRDQDYYLDLIQGQSRFVPNYKRFIYEGLAKA